MGGGWGTGWTSGDLSDLNRGESRVSGDAWSERFGLARSGGGVLVEVGGGGGVWVVMKEGYGAGGCFWGVVFGENVAKEEDHENLWCRDPFRFYAPTDLQSRQLHSVIRIDMPYDEKYMRKTKRHVAINELFIDLEKAAWIRSLSQLVEMAMAGMDADCG
ncbi:hypothetical protein Tco_1360720 [Tanacetum coccineum]